MTSGDNFASPVALDIAAGPRLIVADTEPEPRRLDHLGQPANGSQGFTTAGVINERDDLVEPSGIGDRARRPRQPRRR